MSRVGKKVIIVPDGVSVELRDGFVFVKGPKGELSTPLHTKVSMKQEEQDGVKQISFSVQRETDPADRAHWGTAQATVDNLVQGVTVGFTKALELEGVGYRVKLEGKNLVLGVGFSHDVHFPIPEGLEASVEKNTITLSGADKRLVGQTAARIRMIRKPEPYKGKGIRYAGEQIRRKVGKAAKASE